MTLLWAVHLSDGLLQPTWYVAGFLGAALLLLPGLYKIRDEEIPQTALLTSAFFVASLIHVKVGPTSIHLLLNGLVGVLLGRRAGLAVAVGLSLQALLLNHGGFTTLGLNICVMALPALLCRQLFVLLHRPSLLRTRWFCPTLVLLSAVVWTLSLVFSVPLLLSGGLTAFTSDDVENALRLTFQPWTLAGAFALGLLAVWIERRLENAPEFALGLLLGELAVLLTLLLNCTILVYGGINTWDRVALLVVVVHLPLAVIEGVILGFALGFLARVKPEMLGLTLPPSPEPPASEDALSPPHYNCSQT